MSLLTAIAVASFILAVLLLFFLRFFTQNSSNKEEAPREVFKPVLTNISQPHKVAEGRRGDPHTCPVCAAKFEHGESIKSKILPPTDSSDRILHISGCPYCCYEGGRKRECPVCGAELALNEYLSARIFNRREKSHVHIVGCPHCRRAKTVKRQKH